MAAWCLKCVPERNEERNPIDQNKASDEFQFSAMMDFGHSSFGHPMSMISYAPPVRPHGSMSHAVSSSLWAAVRARGCQFLGPAMQEEVLRLIILVLENGAALSRKVLVMFVVQKLSQTFPHLASKTAIGHVVQILYRGSCFRLIKREGDSSLMQLKEEYYTYEALRRQHDTQIVSIAMETGLRISPDQWSSLLYGDRSHKSHMQSIVDKLQNKHLLNSQTMNYINSSPTPNLPVIEPSSSSPQGVNDHENKQ